METCYNREPSPMEWHRGNLQLIKADPAAGEDGAEMVVADPKMRQTLQLAKRIARTDCTVILYGESGTGKDVLARYIYRNSDRADNPFIPVNCAAIPSELLESEFFGYERGTFTGASKDGKAGLFEKASDGTLFLDEIGELPLPMQSKLLRVLENGEVRRVGGSVTIKTDVRIIAATNRNLRQMVAEQLFREDLYYRLNVIPLQVRSLRERTADIEALANHFLAAFNDRTGRRLSLTPDGLELLKSWGWPGNIRELKNIIERAAVMAPGPIISRGFLESMLGYEQLEPAPLPEPVELREGFCGGSLKEAVASFEREYIGNALKLYHGNVSKAATFLQISRSGLYKKLEKSD